jgi:hypothetical protein
MEFLKGKGKPLQQLLISASFPDCKSIMESLAPKSKHRNVAGKRFSEVY